MGPRSSATRPRPALRTAARAISTPARTTAAASSPYFRAFAPNVFVVTTSGARREVRLVDRLHVLGPGQVPRLRQLAGRKAPRLQLRAHRAVQQDDALAQFLQHLSSSDSSLFFSRRKGQSLRAQVLQGGAGSGASARPAPGGRSPCT